MGRANCELFWKCRMKQRLGVVIIVASILSLSACDKEPDEVSRKDKPKKVVQIIERFETAITTPGSNIDEFTEYLTKHISDTRGLRYIGWQGVDGQLDALESAEESARSWLSEKGLKPGINERGLITLATGNSELKCLFDVLERTACYINEKIIGSSRNRTINADDTETNTSTTTARCKLESITVERQTEESGSIGGDHEFKENWKVSINGHPGATISEHLSVIGADRVSKMSETERESVTVEHVAIDVFRVNGKKAPRPEEGWACVFLFGEVGS